MLGKEILFTLAVDFTETSPFNHVTAEQALQPDFAGMRLYDAPLMGCAAAGDAIFQEFLQPGIIGPHFCPPAYWLPDAQTVVSFFFPFTERIRNATRRDMSWPAQEWLHGRIQGQEMLLAFGEYLWAELEQSGYSVALPMKDPRFISHGAQPPANAAAAALPRYNSVWSERHAAYAAGLGTFSLSRGLITAKGMAGRFISFITNAVLEPDARDYDEYDAYCIKCGACVSHCPPGAIALGKEKDQDLCGAFLGKVQKACAPYYGCGMCQVAVPCESRNPSRQC